MHYLFFLGLIFTASFSGTFEQETKESKYNVSGGLYELSEDGKALKHRTSEDISRLNEETYIPFSKLKNVTMIYDQYSNREQLVLEWTDSAGVEFARMTERNIGKEIAIVVNDEIVSAPIVQSMITGGKCNISIAEEKEYYLNAFGLMKESKENE